MDEADLIKRFTDLNSQILDKKSKIKHAEDQTPYLKELYLLEKDLEYTISQIKASPDKTSTLKKVEKVKSILTQLTKKFSKADYPYKFSRDQGLIIHAFILIKIVEDISYALDHDLSIASDYYLEIGSEFECDEIVRILKDAFEFINNQMINNYVELYDYVRSVQKQIVSIDKDCGRMII